MGKLDYKDAGMKKYPVKGVTSQRQNESDTQNGTDIKDTRQYVD